MASNVVVVQNREDALAVVLLTLLAARK